MLFQACFLGMPAYFGASFIKSEQPTYREGLHSLFGNKISESFWFSEPTNSIRAGWTICKEQFIQWMSPFFFANCLQTDSDFTYLFATQSCLTNVVCKQISVNGLPASCLLPVFFCVFDIEAARLVTGVTWWVFFCPLIAWPPFNKLFPLHLKRISFPDQTQ